MRTPRFGMEAFPPGDSRPAVLRSPSRSQVLRLRSAREPGPPSPRTCWTKGATGSKRAYRFGPLEGRSPARRRSEWAPPGAGAPLSAAPVANWYDKHTGSAGPRPTGPPPPRAGVWVRPQVKAWVGRRPADRSERIEQRRIHRLQQCRQFLAQCLGIALDQGIERKQRPLFDGRCIQVGEHPVREAPEGLLQRLDEQRMAGAVRGPGRQPQQLELLAHPASAVLLPVSLLSQREAGTYQLIQVFLAGVLAAGRQQLHRDFSLQGEEPFQQPSPVRVGAAFFRQGQLQALQRERLVQRPRCDSGAQDV